MPRLVAEEELLARSVAVHPHLEVKDQHRIITRLSKTAGLEEPTRTPTRADIGAIGIQVVGD